MQLAELMSTVRCPAAALTALYLSEIWASLGCVYPASAWVSARSPSCPKQHRAPSRRSEPQKSALFPLCRGAGDAARPRCAHCVPSLPAGTWVTFGGQITDEVRTAHSLSSSSGCTGAAALGVPMPRHPLSPPQMAEQLMTLAYDNGINLFDTAEVYAAGK